MNMYKNIAIAVLCLGFIVGCGDKESPTVMAKPEAGQGNANKVEETKSETAIYFPGGAGIDFGIKPVSDNLKKDNNGEYRVVVYEFSEPFAAVDKALSEVLTKKSYLRELREAKPAYDLVVVYRKPGENKILVRYSTLVREGFNKLTVVKFSWGLN